MKLKIVHNSNEINIIIKYRTLKKYKNNNILQNKI